VLVASILSDSNNDNVSSTHSVTVPFHSARSSPPCSAAGPSPSSSVRRPPSLPPLRVRLRRPEPRGLGPAGLPASAAARAMQRMGALGVDPFGVLQAPMGFGHGVFLRPGWVCPSAGRGAVAPPPPPFPPTAEALGLRVDAGKTYAFFCLTRGREGLASLETRNDSVWPCV
jgi:hypothetical protein